MFTAMRSWTPCLLLLFACTPQAPEPTDASASSSAPAKLEPEPPRPEQAPAKPPPTERRVTLEIATTVEHQVLWQRTEPRELHLLREQLLAADPAGNRAWVSRATHIHDEDLAEPYSRDYFAELLEIDLDEQQARVALRGVVAKSNVETHELYGHLWPLVDQPEDLAVLGELVMAGHAVAQVFLDPERERLFHWDHAGHVRASDLRGGPLELSPSDIVSLGFGIDGSHRAYGTCDVTIADCARGEKGVWVERNGSKQRVPTLDWVDEIRWSPTLQAFFASTDHGTRHEEGCIYRIAADGSEATLLICVGKDEVDVDFTPDVRRAMIGSFFDRDESARRYAWVDLERGVVETSAVVERTREVDCLYDDGLTLALINGGEQEGLVVFTPNSERGGLLLGDFTDVACERFADGSVIVMRWDPIESSNYVKQEDGKLVEEKGLEHDGRFSLIRVDLDAVRPN
jgi:hypothetical protein